jgi:hypothetical protein
MTYTRFTNSQSPQATRGTSQDFEKFSKGDVKLGMTEPKKDGQHGWDIEQDRGGDAARPA